MSARVTIPELGRMKEERRKITAIVAWDYQMARLADRVGAEIVVVGDSVGVNLWGHTSPLQVTLEQMICVCQAVRNGVRDALVCCDFPYGVLQTGTASAVNAAVRLVKEASPDMVKLDAAGDYPEAVTAVARAGVPVFAQLGITPQRALRFGIDYKQMSGSAALVPTELTEELVAEARLLENAGASLLDFTNSGPVVGPAVVRAVSIPVLGGLGGGPWLDGRVRMAHAAIGYAADGVDVAPDSYANVARIAFDALREYVADVRAERQIKGAR